MKRVIFGAVAFALLCSMPQGLRAAEYRSADSSISISASSIEFMTSAVLAKGKAHVETVDKKTGSAMVSDSSELYIQFFQNPASQKGTSGLDMVKSAKITGPVKIVYTSVDQLGLKSKSTATADNGVYVGGEKSIRLIGNVKIIYDNPGIFDLPAIATGDSALVNLKTNLGPDEPRFRIETTSGLSHLELTPSKKTIQDKSPAKPQETK